MPAIRRVELSSSERQELEALANAGPTSCAPKELFQRWGLDPKTPRVHPYLERGSTAVHLGEVGRADP